MRYLRVRVLGSDSVAVASELLWFSGHWVWNHGQQRT